MKNALKQKNELWDLLNKIWDNGDNRSSDVKNYYDYWKGVIKRPSGMSETLFNDSNITSCNVCSEIVETKLAAMLDAQFTTSVVPEIQSFADLQTLKNQQAYADILHSEMQNILDRNNICDIKEKVGRWGLIAGFGALQTLWEQSNNPVGDIKLTVVEPSAMKWDKFASNIDQTTFMAYQLELNPSFVKEQYCKKADGSYDEELCKKIDEIAETKAMPIIKGSPKSVVALQTAQSSDLAYVYDNPTQGINSGKMVKLIVMFIMDDSLYLDEDSDTQEISKMYPNGRMVVFSPDKEKKIILEDKPAPEGFKNLGNIDLFNPIDFDGIVGRSEIEPLTPIQERINGSLFKVRLLIQNHISTLFAEKGEIEDSSFVMQPIIYGEGTEKPPVLVSNEAINYAMQLMQYIDVLKQQARDTARLNETMINGTRQKGTTSAEQVEALQESPMASIRMIQRNFKDFMIHVGEKIIMLIQQYYSMKRLIKLSTGISDAQYARFFEDETGSRNIELLKIDPTNPTALAYEVVKSFKIDPEWKFKVQVTAGTEIPRSRHENAMLMDKLYNSGFLGDPTNIELKEQYLKSIDMPNYRMFIDMMKKQEEEQKKAGPTQTTINQILADPDLANGFNKLMDALKVNSTAKGEVIAMVGLSPQVDKLEDAPIQDVTSQGDVKDVVAVAPNMVSRDPKIDLNSRVVSAEIIESRGGKK